MLLLLKFFIFIFGSEFAGSLADFALVKRILEHAEAFEVSHRLARIGLLQRFIQSIAALALVEEVAALAEER